MSRIHLALPMAVLCTLLLPARAARPAPKPLTAQEQKIKAVLWQLVRRQDEAVLRGDDALLRPLYVATSGQTAMKHAMARRAFLRAWQTARRVRLDAVSVDVRTPGIEFRGSDRVQISAVVSENFHYHHMEGAKEAEGFGLGTRRWYLLQDTPDGWRIRSEDYTDPLDQDTRIPGEALPSSVDIRQTGFSGPLRYTAPGAHAAARYVDRYCGAAPGCGNNRRYNPRYTDFNGEGGDCTNFVSQSLYASGFRQTAGWSWDPRKGDGTRAWSNAEGLVDYLLSSGRARIVAGGTYSALSYPSERFPRAPISLVEPGDIVGYREDGKIVHLALVVGRDPGGYVLVDSHTADRYHVPWDIGWDRSTRFYLIHVNYPRRAPMLRAT